jgi:hypothetical protein
MQKLLESPKAPWLVLGLTFLVTLSSIELGFYNDDHAWRGALSGNWAEGPAWWDLYRFAEPALNPMLRETGALPWWTTLEMKLHFLRPLTSASLFLDYQLFENAPLGYHLHSMAWYLALVASAGYFFRALLPAATAHLALLIFALSGAHFYPWAWVSCRHMLLAAVPCVLGLAAFVRAPRAGPVLYALGFLIGLTASETALGSLAFPLAHVAFDRTRAFGARLVRLVPALVVVSAYLVVYRAFGAGAAGGDGYLDPFHAPLAFALRAAQHVPILMGNALLTFPSELALVGAAVPLLILGLLACLLVARLWHTSRPAFEPSERSALPWLVVAAVLACVPSLGAFPGGRVLLLPNLGFAPLIAVLLLRGFPGARWPRKIALGFLTFVHVLAAPLVSVANAFHNGGIARNLEHITATADWGDARPRAFLLGVSDPMVTMYVPAVLSSMGRKRITCWSVLSGAKANHFLTRVGERELLVRPTRGAFATEPFETLFRSMREPFGVGEESRQCGATFRVTRVNAEHRPTEVRVTFDRPLEDPSLRFLVWREGRLARLPPPPPGHTLEIPWSPGPLGAF